MSAMAGLCPSIIKSRALRWTFWQLAANWQLQGKKLQQPPRMQNWAFFVLLLCSECLWELEIGAGLEIERQEWGFPGHMGQTRTSKSLTCRQLYYQVLLKGDRKHECASCFCQKRESVASVSSCGQSCQFLISTIMGSFS